MSTEKNTRGIKRLERFGIVLSLGPAIVTVLEMLLNSLASLPIGHSQAFLDDRFSELSNLIDVSITTDEVPTWSLEVVIVEQASIRSQLEDLVVHH